MLVTHIAVVVDEDAFATASRSATSSAPSAACLLVDYVQRIFRVSFPAEVVGAASGLSKKRFVATPKLEDRQDVRFCLCVDVWHASNTTGQPPLLGSIAAAWW